jgi:hypothetical protein
MNEDYMTDAMGRLVPVGIVSEIDKLRDQTVKSIMAEALRMREQLGAFKKRIREDVTAFVEISAGKYGKSWGGRKGNFTLSTYDGKYRLVVAMDDNIYFDERLQVARDTIGECINKWSEGARDEMRVLINDAFQVDKTGKVNTARVLGLRKLEIDDADWRAAMQMITDSIQVTGSKQYIRFYERGDNGEYRQIPMDVAAL